MFRKNFREGGAKSGGGGASKLNTKSRNPGKRSREMAYGGGNTDPDVHYRTHIFFAPSRAGLGGDCEGWELFFVVCAVCCCLLYCL